MPPWPYMGIFLWRTFLIWCAAHVLSFRLGAFPFRSFVLALAAAVILLLLDVQRRSERRFLANLGVSRLAVVGIIAAGFSILELALFLVFGGSTG
ncbi:MAG: hypothetical protein JSU87_02565 [Gemmatimonadota bacterium]|nr:MAG: hypothetical protein JSU87_02565 [Gemmatimonadota bacterium]